MFVDNDGDLKFINHACYYIESMNSILICDPWVEGLAFNGGWSLLDQSSSNKETINDLIKSKKKIFIWYSHEHSDHFSISFLKEIYTKIPKITVIFQKTLDKRVIKFLNNKNINFIEAIDGKKIILDSNLSIFIWAHKNGDSYSLVKYKNFKILNLNDCIVNNKKEANKISSKIKKITNNLDFLFTQFGYANWIGNKEDEELRLKAAAEKIDRLLLQHNYLFPKFIIPYASFINFCDKENFYLNSQQNTPEKVKNSPLLKSIKNKIFFLKPMDIINLNHSYKFSNKLEHLSINAIEHWQNLFANAKPKKMQINTIELNVLKNESIKLLKLINKSFLFLPAILEAFKLIKPVSIYVKDIDQIIYFSYLKNNKICKNDEWSIKIYSEDLKYSISHDYGFNTLRVNGKFEVKNKATYKNFIYFFYFQDLLKENITIKKPKTLLKKILQISIIFIKNTISFRI